MTLRRNQKRNTTKKTHPRKLNKRKGFDYHVFFSLKNLKIRPSIGVLIAIGIFLAGSVLLISLLSLLGEQADNQKIQVRKISPSVCVGWQNSSAAKQIDILESGTSKDFSINNSAYVKTDTMSGIPDAQEHVAKFEPQRITCSGFEVLDLDVFDIRSSVLEVSLGASIVGDAQDIISVAYSFDGTSWQTIESHLIEASFGNSNLDGYRRYAFTDIVNTENIEDFQVRFSYYSKSVNTKTGVYLDGVQFSLEAQRKLAVPDIPEDIIQMGKLEFNAFEQPTFVIQVDDGGIPLFTKHSERSVKSIELRDPTNQLSNNVVTLAVEDKKFMEYAIDQNAFSKPGKYTLSIVLEEDGAEKLFIQEFSWGVLAINPDKSNYTVGETADFSIAVLDDGGGIVCDADVELQIINPLGQTTKLSTDQGDIIVTDFCKKKEEFKEPDYYTSFPITYPGEHTLILSASHANGVFSIEDSFSVVASQQFSLQRFGPTRVFPKVWQPMELRVTAYQDFEGIVTEILPDGFEIEKSDQYVVTEIPKDGRTVNEIRWSVSLSEGQSTVYRYRFKPPQVSPAFYVIGEATIGDWEENRVWQLAVDPTYLYLLANTGTGVASGWVLDTGSDGNFLHAASTAGGTGGNATHTHTFTESVGSASATVQTRTTFLGEAQSADNHTHTSSGSSIATANNDPANHTFYLWKYNTIDVTPPDIPDNTFALFADADVPLSPWTQFSAADNRLIKINNSHTTGGSDTHTHAITWGSLNAASGTDDAELLKVGSIPYYAALSHTHTAPSSSSTASATSIPLYSTLQLYEQTSATSQALPTGMIALFDGAPPSGWTTISDASPYLNTFIRTTTTSGSTGGSSTNTHTSAVGTTGGPSSTVDGNASPPAGSDFGDPAHTHQITLSSFSSSSHDPVYEDYILASYDGATAIDISGNILGTDESTAIGNPPCDGVTSNVSLRVNGGTASTTTCDATTGAYSFTGITASAGDTVTIYLTSTEKANLVMIASGSNITGADLYQDRVILRDDDDATLSILDTLDYDNDQNATDMLFDADDLATDTFTVDSNIELHIWTGDTFDPNGTITTQGTGDLHVLGTAYLDTATNTIADQILVPTGGTLNISQDTNINGDTNTVYVTGGTLNQTGGTLTVGDGIVEDMNITSGTASFSGGTTTIKEQFDISGGTITISNIFNLTNAVSYFEVTGGTVNINAGADINLSDRFYQHADGSIVNLNGGSMDSADYWLLYAGTFNFNGGTHKVATTESTGSLYFNGSTVTGITFNMTGSGTISTRELESSNNGRNFTSTTTGGTIEINGQNTTLGLNILEATNDMNFYNITISGTTTASALQTADIINDLTINSGVTFTTNDVAIPIDNDLIIQSTGVMVAGASTLTVGGSFNDSGTFTAGTSSVIMTGTGSINGSSDTSFYNLTIGDLTAGTVTTSGSNDPTITNNLDITTGDTLSVDSGRVVTFADGGIFTFSGTLSGSGRFDYQDVQTFPSTGTQGSTLTIRFDTVSANLIFSPRTFDGPVEIYGGNVTTRTVYADTGTTTFNGTVTTIQGAGNVIFDLNTFTQTNTIFKEDITIGSGTTFEASSGTLIFDTLHFYDNGTFNHNNGTIEFTGVNSYIDGSSDTTFYNFTNNTALNVINVGAFGGANDPTVVGTIGLGANTSYLLVSTGRTFTFDSSSTFTMDASAGIQSSGTGLFIYKSTNAFPITGDLANPTYLRFDSSSNNVAISARSYRHVEIYGNNSSNTVTADAGTYAIFDDLTTTQDGTGNTTLQLDTNDPTLTVSGDFIIGANTTIQASASATLSLLGNATQGGAFTSNGGTVSLDGTAQQSVANFCSSCGGSFGALIITNSSGSDPDASPSIIFTSNIDVITYTINTAGVKVRYNDNIVFTTTGLTLNGATGAGNQVYFRSSTPGTNYTFTFADIYGQTLTYVDAQDADSSFGATINATGTGNINSGNNINWNFGSILITGTVYDDIGITPFDCSATNLTINISVNGDITPDVVTCIASDGTYSFSATNPSATDDLIVMYIDGVEAQSATTVSLALDQYQDATMDLYIDYVLTDSETGNPMTNTLLDTYDAGDDADIDYTVTTGNMTVSSGHGLVTSRSYTPGGTLTTPASSTNAGIVNDGGDGDIVINSSMTLSMASNALSIGGDIDNNGTLQRGSGQVTTFTGTTTGFTIDTLGNWWDVVFNGSGGGWSFSAATTTLSGDMTVTAGTLSGTNIIQVTGGSISGDGIINMTGGNFGVFNSSSFGGNTAWNFYDLTFESNGISNITSTAIGTGSVTVTNVLKLEGIYDLGCDCVYSHSLDGGSKTWILTGSGTPFDKSGSFNGNTSTFRYTGTGTVNVTRASSETVDNYYNLELSPASSSSYSFVGTSYYINNDLTISPNTNLNPSTSTTYLKGSPTINAGGQKLYNVDMATTGTVTATMSSTDWEISGTLTEGALSDIVVPSGLTLTISGPEPVSPSTSGLGTVRFVSTSGGPGSDPSAYDNIIRFDATNGDIASTTVDAGTYLKKVEFYTSDDTTARSITLPLGTFNFNSDLHVINDGDGAGFGALSLTVTGATNNPTVNVTGDIDFPAVSKDGGEALVTGTGTWTASGHVDTVCDGGGLINSCITATAGNTFIMNGASKTLTTLAITSAQHFYDIEFSGSITISDRLYIDNTILISGTLTGSTNSIYIDNGWINNGTFNNGGGTVFFDGTAGTIDGSSNTAFNNLTIAPSGDATITLQTSDPTVGGVLNVISGDILTINSGRVLEIENGGTLTLSGTINGAGTLRYSEITTAFPDTGTMNAILEMNPYDGDQILNDRTLGGDLRIICSGIGSPLSLRTVTVTAGTLPITGDLLVEDGLCSIAGLVFDLNTNDPTTTIDGSITVNDGATFEAPSATVLTLKGNFTQGGAGVFNDNLGEVILAGTTTQTLTGVLSGTSNDFYDLSITNTSGSVTACETAFTPGVSFGSSVDIANDFEILTTPLAGGVNVEFNSASTYTVNRFNWVGASGKVITARNSNLTSGTWLLNVTTLIPSSVSYVDVGRSDASSGIEIIGTNGTNTDCGNNTNWLFDSINFSISDTAIGYGVLSSVASRYATGDTTGSATEVEAHTISARSTHPYVITVQGATLTAGSDTITAIGGTNASPSAGTEQFGLRMTATGGSGTVSVPYDGLGFAYNATASTSDEIGSCTATCSTVTAFSVRYLGNITTETEAGAYVADLTYIMTATF